MTYEEEQIANLILSLKQLKGVGNRTIIKLLIENKVKIQDAVNYNEEFLRLLNIKAINSGLDSAEEDWRSIQKNISFTLETAFNKGIFVLHPFMKNYPQRLLINSNFPPILFCIGDISLLNSEKIVTVIGTREPTEYGSKMGLRLSEILSEEGYVIVSGLAKGSDSIGHQGALNASGKTIAILPTPIDGPVYPQENSLLADQIIENGGALLSEYSPGSSLHGRELVQNLVARDEWQAGLCDGVIVIETSTDGGSNHAIKHAIKIEKPIAVFDYRSRLEDFEQDLRYSGNVKYLKNKLAEPLFQPETVQNFKMLMGQYRSQIDMRIQECDFHIEENLQLVEEQIKFPNL